MLITASEIIKNSWETYSKNWRSLIPYMALLFISSAVLGLVGIVGLKIETILGKGSLVLLNNLIVAALDVILLLFTLWTTIALFKNLRNIIENRGMIAIKESYTQTSKYLWPVIWSSFLMGLAVLGGFVLFIIPAVIFAIWFTYVFYTVIFEDKIGVTALKSSKELVVGRWWKTFWLLLAPGFFYGIIIAALQGVFTLPLGILFEEKTITFVLTNSLFTTLISSLFAPLTALTTLYLYLSAKENPIATNLPKQ